jgi:hypothetical protein
MTPTKLTVTERLIVALLRLHPGLSFHRLIELTGSKTPSHLRSALRTLVMAGLVVEQPGQDYTTEYVSGDVHVR